MGRQPLLLDTCAALWAVADEMPERVVQAMDEGRRAGLPVYVSPITAWEIGQLARKGRFKSNYTPQRWFERLMETPDTALAPLTPEVLLGSAFLPGPIHKDPADRVLAATAREFGFTIVTRDKALLDYGAEGHIAVLPC